MRCSSSLVSNPDKCNHYLFERLDLAVLTEELVDAYRSLTRSAGLSLSFEHTPITKPTYVDREMWEKIVLNLVSNAIKFTFAGTISVRLHQVDDHIELVVRDTGTGIPEQKLPRLFERFHRVEGARARSAEGSGIGLALVSELVNLHGGPCSEPRRRGQHLHCFNSHWFGPSRSRPYRRFTPDRFEGDRRALI